MQANFRVIDQLIQKTILILIILIVIVFTSELIKADFQIELDLDQRPERAFKIINTELTLPKFHVKGIYVTGWVAGTKDLMDDLIQLVDDTIINTMVIDIKCKRGFLSYSSEVGLAKEIKANRHKVRDIKGLLAELKLKGIYTIGRLVVFKDGLLATTRPDLALPLKDSENEEIIYSKAWVDPAQQEVWSYIVLLAREAVKLGFDEIQFDYIRYPALASMPRQAVVAGNKYKSQIIGGFLQYAKQELADLDIPLSIDVFGSTTRVKGDLGIGQNFQELSGIIDIISPMVYPSHYSPGSYGVEDPDAEPYHIIYRSLADAQEKVTANKNIIIRPWLQDFSLRHLYSVQEVKEQIKATEDLGLKEWLLWNPRSQYTKEALLLAAE